MPFLPQESFEFLIRLRQDTATLYNACIEYHHTVRKNRLKWPSMMDFAGQMSGNTAEIGLLLGTQSQNLVFAEFIGNVDSASANRKTERASGEKDLTSYPWRFRNTRDCHWDRRDCKNVPGGFTLGLAKTKDEKAKSGLKRQAPLFIPYRPGIPKNCSAITIHYSWEDKTFYLLFKIKEKKKNHVLPTATKSMGIDLGQLRIAAAMTETGESLNIKGRGLRTIQQYHNKKKSFRRSNIDLKVKGSNNRKKEVAKLARESKRSRNQKDNFIHTTTRRLVDFANETGVTEFFVGDPHGVRDQDIGARQNQANSDWSTGIVFQQITYKAAMDYGIKTRKDDERGTTRTCPCCGNKKKPSGRVYKCAECGFVGHRDAVGAWNIMVNGHESVHGKKPSLKNEFLNLENQKYLTPVGVDGVRRNPVPRKPKRVVSSAGQPRSEGSKGQSEACPEVKGLTHPTGMEQVGRKSDGHENLKKLA